MNSMSQVEYFSGSTLVRVSQQFTIESAIIDKNGSHFKLAYLSLLLNFLLLDRLSMRSEKNELIVYSMK